MQPKRMWVAGAVLALSLIGGCQQHDSMQVSGTLTRPAEINMAGYESVRLDPISGQGGDQMAGRVKQQLVAAKFAVVDGAGAAAKPAQQLALANPEPAHPAQAGVAIKGQVLSQNATQENSLQDWRDSTGHIARMYVSECQAVVKAQLDVVDLATNSVTSKTLTATASGKSDPQPKPAQFNPQPLYAQCYDQIARQFASAMAPRNQPVIVQMFVDESNSSNVIGVGLFRAGKYSQAAGEFEKAATYAKVQPGVASRTLGGISHNLGLAYEFAGDLDKAEAAYRNTMTVYPQNTEAQASLARCAQRKADAAQGKKQGA